MFQESPQIGLANRMVLGVAMQIKTFAAATFGGDVVEVDGQPIKLDILIVGRRHIHQDHREVFGYDVLDGLVATHRPTAVLYVIPSALRPRAYDKDLDALEAVATRTKTCVLELPNLHALGPDRAKEVALQTLRTMERGDVVPLLPLDAPAHD